jgi:hypothetical protein
MKVRKNTSDKKFESWIYESVFKDKGFVRESGVGNIAGI